MPLENIGRRALLALGGATLVVGFAGPLHAQDGTPLRVILPFSSGSGVDVIVRSAQPTLIKALARPVVIENLPGAGGIKGTQALVSAAPDGNTIAFVSNNHAVNPSVYKSLPYDSIADVTPITIVGGSPFVFVVNPDVPAKTATELQALMKSRPGELNYASSGNGTIIHLAGAMFIDEAGVNARHIPYKGMGPMITDMIGGHVEMGAGAVAAVQSHLRSGALRAIGVMGKERIASLPDVPTLAEQGFPGVDVGGWFAVIGPKGMQADQVERLREGIAAAFNDPEVKAAFAKRDDFLTLSSPEEAGRFLASEQKRYGDLARKANVRLD